MASFELAIAGLLQREGGDTITNDPNDAGGLTHWGITLAEFKQHGADLDGDGDIDAADLRCMNESQAETFYDKNYWDALSLDQLMAQGVASKLFDTAVNLGRGAAAKFLQKAAGTTVDGAVGPKTLAAANALSATALMDKLVSTQEDYYWSITLANVKAKAGLPLSQGGLGWKSSWIPIALDAIKARNLQSIAILNSTIKATPGTLQGNLRFIKGWISRASLRFGV